jgi:hypothetical protein
MSTTFVRGENPLKADKLNTAFSERVSRGGDTMQGFLKLAADPVQAFDAATKQYVDRFTSMGVPTGAYIGSAPPGNVLGPLWWDTNSGQLFIQYNDGTSTQWVSASSVTADQLLASNLFLPLTGGTVTGPLNYTATGGTTVRSAQDRAAEVVNVKDFGAKGDGVTDDTAAINAALNYIRANKIFVSGGSTHSPFKLVFPSARYLVTAPLNFTGLASIPGGVIDGQGSEIWAKMSGGVVIDCTGSRWLRFQDLAIYGDPTTTPKIGIQFAKVINASADYHTLMRVNVWGNFTFTALYNCGSENFGVYDCSFNNAATGSNRFGAVLDGLNHWNTQSTFVTVTNPVETVASFQQCVFVNSAFFSVATGGVIWMGACQRHAFKRCYMADTTAGSNVLTVYQPNTGAPALDFIEFDVHVETNAIANVVIVTAPAGKTAAGIYCLNISDDACQATVAVFAIDPSSPLTSVELREATINVWAANANLVDTPSKWVIRAKQASIYSPARFNTPAYWSGPISFVTNPAVSFYTIDKWTSSARPTAPGGSIGFATDTAQLELFDGAVWHSFLPLDAGGTINGPVTFAGAGNGLIVYNQSFLYGALTINGGALNVGNGSLAGAATEYIQSAAGNNRFIGFLSGSGGAAGRWYVGANGTAEPGSGNVGSDFVFQRYSDGGGFLDNALLITRSTGSVTLHNSLGVWNATPPASKPSVTGAKGSNAALASLLTALAAYGLITDSSSA